MSCCFFHRTFLFLSLCSSAIVSLIDCMVCHGLFRSFSFTFHFSTCFFSCFFSFFFLRSHLSRYNGTLLDKHLETHFAHLEDTSWFDETRCFETAWRCGDNCFRWKIVRPTRACVPRHPTPNPLFPFAVSSRSLGRRDRELSVAKFTDERSRRSREISRSVS